MALEYGKSDTLKLKHSDKNHLQIKSIIRLFNVATEQEGSGGLKLRWFKLLSR